MTTNRSKLARKRAVVDARARHVFAIRPSEPEFCLLCGRREDNEIHEVGP